MPFSVLKSFFAAAQMSLKNQVTDEESQESGSSDTGGFTVDINTAGMGQTTIPPFLNLAR